MIHVYAEFTNDFSSKSWLEKCTVYTKKSLSAEGIMRDMLISMFFTILSYRHAMARVPEGEIR